MNSEVTILQEDTSNDTMVSYRMVTKNTMLEAIQPDESRSVYFAGVSKDSSFIQTLIGSDYQEAIDLLIKAVNNRTVERDYFHLYSQLLDDEISEEDFDKELEEHEDKYVLDGTEIPTVEKLKLALKLCSQIHDVKTSEDLSSLFSFNSEKVDSVLCKIDNNGNLH